MTQQSPSSHFEPIYGVDVSISPDGSVNETFSDGVEQLIGVVTLAYFDHPAALAVAGTNLYSATQASGAANFAFVGDPSVASAIDVVGAAGLTILSSSSATCDEIIATTSRVYKIDAKDINAGARIVYSISGGDDANLFNIDPSTGVVTFKTSPNFEAPADTGADNVYNLSLIHI